MAAPTYVNQYPTAFDTNTTPKTCMSAVSISSADVLIGMQVIADVSLQTYAITENGTAAWVAQQSYDASGSCPTYLSSYTATGNESLTVTVTESTADKIFGGSVVRFSGTAGVGVSNKAQATSGSPSVTLTGVSANSAIVVVCADWAARSAAQGGADAWTSNGGAGSATPLTGYPGDEFNYGVHIAYYADAGTAGNKTVGMSAPTGQSWNMIAIEVKGTAGGGGAPIAALSSDNCNNVWQR